MASRTRILFAVPVAVAMLTAPIAAQADWRGHGGWHHEGWRGGGWGYRPHAGAAPLVAGALLGLGLGAVVAGAFAPPPPPPVYYAPPPPVVYAPPPVYYPPPAYYGAPAY